MVPLENMRSAGCWYEYDLWIALQAGVAGVFLLHLKLQTQGSLAHALILLLSLEIKHSNER